MTTPPAEKGPYRAEQQNGQFYNVVGPTPWPIGYGYLEYAQEIADRLNLAHHAARADLLKVLGEISTLKCTNCKDTHESMAEIARSALSRLAGLEGE